MAVLYDPFVDPSRVYYGTDTRAATLLVGAAAAMMWRPWQEGAGRAAPSAARLLDGVGLGALAGLVAFFLLAPDNAAWMYRGGFLLVAILSVLLVAVVVHPSAQFAPRFFGASVLVWIGLRSYGIYLWHWPVFMVTRPEDVPLDGLALDALRLGVTIGLAALSFRIVEDPIRHGALGQWFRGLRTLPPNERSRARGSTAVALVGIGSLVVVCAAGLVQAKPSDDSDIAIDQGPAPQISLSSDPGGGDPTSTPDPEPSGGSSPGASPSPSSSDSPSAGPSAATGPPFSPPIRVGLFGDSTGMTLALNEPAGLDDYLTISDETVEGCSVLAAKIVSSTGFRRDLGSECSDWRQKWEDKAAVLDPQIALVNLGAWDVFDLEIDGAAVPFGTPEWDSYFKGQLKLAIRTLVDSGAQVALVDVPCFRPVEAGGLPLLPERGDDERTRHLNELMRTVGANYPGRVYSVTPPKEFCKDPDIATDLGYRWDGTHYYKPGAKLFFDVVTPQLLAIPSPA